MSLLPRCSVCGHPHWALVDDPKLRTFPHAERVTTSFLAPLGPHRLGGTHVGRHLPTLEHHERETPCWCVRCLKQRRIEIYEHYMLMTDEQILNVFDGAPSLHRALYAEKLRRAIADASS